MTLPADYLERVYAGVLGKMIGVYLGRPFEGWTYEKIMHELGEIRGYVNEQRGVPLIVTDDDLSGTFTFLRALPDYGNNRYLTPQQIGQTWLNYIIKERTILWWGGVGNSTEHTAYQRLRKGIPAPQSGSIALNSKVVAEQIGAQIFIDGWAMVAPGDPEFAADLARRAASVSHDGEAVYGAQVIAAMEAQAFVESDIQALINCAITFIPEDSVIYRLINDVREWHTEVRDWRDARALIENQYGYDKYGGNCHIVPNHALIIMSLLYGDDDFQKSLMIVNTSGWDTDCNSGNVGCLLGIKNGLRTIDTKWRDPVADRLYLPTADGGRAITDAVRETFEVVNIGRAFAGEPSLSPKNGARFHFELQGSVQGFSSKNIRLENIAGFSQSGKRSLAVHYPRGKAQTFTPTFIPPSDKSMGGYGLLASPTLYPGQTVSAAVTASSSNPTPTAIRLCASVYDGEDQVQKYYGDTQSLNPNTTSHLIWQLPSEIGGAPIAEVGLEIESTDAGTVYLDWLTWDGTPDVTFTRLKPGSWGQKPMWQKAWVDAMDQFESWWSEAFRLIQNDGRGMISIGTREWDDYSVSTTLHVHLAKAAGIAVRVQGLERYYTLLIGPDSKARLIKRLDGEQVLAEANIEFDYGKTYDIALEVEGSHIRGQINGHLLFDVEDIERVLSDGGIGVICEEGRIGFEAITVSPLSQL